MIRRPCVRCGSEPRAEDLFVGVACADDPAKIDEVSQARCMTSDFVGSERERRLEQRRILVSTFQWAGRWSPRG